MKVILEEKGVVEKEVSYPVLVKAKCEGGVVALMCNKNHGVVLAKGKLTNSGILWNVGEIFSNEVFGGSRHWNEALCVLNPSVKITMSNE